MKSNLKWIISIVAGIAAIGAVVAAVIVFWDQILDLINRCPKPKFRPKEYDDYADVE